MFLSDTHIFLLKNCSARPVGLRQLFQKHTLAHSILRISCTQDSQTTINGMCYHKLMKTKRYWLIGGVIGFVISIVGTLGFFIGVGGIGFFYVFGMGWSVLMTAVNNGLLSQYFSTTHKDLPMVIAGLVFNSIIYCVAGLFIGWLYGKIKNRNKIPQI